MRIVFFGTPDFAAEVLEFLIQKRENIVAVVSKPDKAQGRSKQLVPVPVKLIAEKHGIPVYQPEKISDPSNVELIQGFNADLFVVVAYGEILKEHVLKAPKIACINLHASLLPKYRGAAPIQRAIMNGEIESGVTIMHMVKKMDAGNMIAHGTVPISQEMTAGELGRSLIEIGSLMMLQVIEAFKKGTPSEIVQDESKVTFAPKIELEECRIDWSRTSTEIHNLIRGVNPEPGAWAMVEVNGQAKRLRVFKSLDHSEKQIALGEQQQQFVGCGQGSLELLEVQPEGKKRMPFQDFLRGQSQRPIKFF
ncbi:MAG: methionyl-tRNA formyltransferase [Parachlamydiaceae bacterium]